MSDLIHIGQVTVPAVDYAVGAAAVLGIRDSGKTVTSKGIAEQLLDRNIPIVVFDAVGKWRWLKVPGETRGKGYKVVVAGGRAPDLALTPQSVPHIVRSALKERIPLVIDLYDKALSKADWRRIVQQAIRIIHYENEGGAVHVFLEEAAEFAPQKVIDGEVYAEVEKLVRMGGNASVGITLINQRSQEVNKAVLDNCTTLILGCQVGNKAIEAVSKWVDRLDSETANEVAVSLPRLTAGEAWVWTRQNPDKPHRIVAPMCRSFHPDRRAPEVVLNSARAKATDTAAFVAQLSASIPKVIEEAKANDPAELKKQLAVAKREHVEMVREIERLKKNVAPVEVEKRVEVPVLSKDDFGDWQELCDQLLEEHWKQEKSLVDAQQKIDEFVTKLSQFTNRPPPKPQGQLATVAKRWKREAAKANIDYSKALTAVHGPVLASGGPLPKGQAAILRAIAQHGGCSREQLTVLTGYKRSSRDTYLQRLGEKGLTDNSGELIEATEQGIQALGPDFEPLPTGDALREHWMNKLPEGERKVLAVLIEAYPDEVSREHIDEATGYQRSSRDTYLQRLRARMLVKANGRGHVSASEILFDE